MRALIARGADVKHRNHDGKNVFRWSTGSIQTSFVQALKMGPSADISLGVPHPPYTVAGYQFDGFQVFDAFDNVQVLNVFADIAIVDILLNKTKPNKRTKFSGTSEWSYFEKNCIEIFILR